MGQITTTQNLVAIKEVRHAGQKSLHWGWRGCKVFPSGHHQQGQQGRPFLDGAVLDIAQILTHSLSRSQYHFWFGLFVCRFLSCETITKLYYTYWIFSFHFISRTQRQPPAILSSIPQLARVPLWPQWALSWLAAGRLILFWPILVVETAFEF